MSQGLQIRATSVAWQQSTIFAMSVIGERVCPGIQRQPYCFAKALGELMSYGE